MVNLHRTFIRETGNVPIFERMGFQTVQENDENCFESDVHDVLADVYMERLLSGEC